MDVNLILLEKIVKNQDNIIQHKERLIVELTKLVELQAEHIKQLEETIVLN